MKRAIGIVAVAAQLGGAPLGAQSVPPRFELDYPAIARKIVERLDMKDGETFLQVARPGMFDELIPHLRYEAMRVGAIDLGVIDVLAEPAPEAWGATQPADDEPATEDDLFLGLEAEEAEEDDLRD